MLALGGHIQIPAQPDRARGRPAQGGRRGWGEGRMRVFGMEGGVGWDRPGSGTGAASALSAGF